MAFLEVRDIKKRFGNEEVLKGISFDLEAGEVLSIIGSSGNGKTTLLRCLNYLESIDDGIVKLSGETILDKNFLKEKSPSVIRNTRTHFGLVFQAFNLFPQYTALENVKLALTLREKEKEKKDLSYIKKEEIDDISTNLLIKVGLESKMNSYPCELSGGQMQRVAIARAMALKPDILCFDEPTSALDPELTGEVLKVIKELKEEFKITMIIVTHEMEFARNISDKVLHLNKGMIASFGTPKEIFESPTDENTKKFIESYERMKR